MIELSKYFLGEIGELKRSEINPATYNPRKITEYKAKNLRNGIEQLGLVGTLIVNANTNNTLVSGHQRLEQLDKLEGYNAKTGENDYLVRVNIIRVSLKKEKEINVLLNNQNAQGDYDFSLLRKLVPEIDTNIVGFNDADLSLIGVNFDSSDIVEPHISAEVLPSPQIISNNPIVLPSIEPKKVKEKARAQPSKQVVEDKPDYIVNLVVKFADKDELENALSHLNKGNGDMIGWKELCDEIKQL